VEHLKGASLGRALALPISIKLGWKGFVGPKDKLNVISFITMAPLIAKICELRTQKVL
jgi:hypothetical protein